MKIKLKENWVWCAVNRKCVAKQPSLKALQEELENIEEILQDHEDLGNYRNRSRKGRGHAKHNQEAGSNNKQEKNICTHFKCKNKPEHEWKYCTNIWYRKYYHGPKREENNNIKGAEDRDARNQGTTSNGIEENMYIKSNKVHAIEESNLVKNIL
mmetsp:Transcript_21041/g.29498  ORF Transcript_21041/g.29498 Transcript_21041/m.29498 type:complete len:155 (+) Transcript_21041:237-701(+)